MRSRRGESVFEAIGFLTLIVLLIGGLVAYFTSYNGYYYMSCISSDGTEKYEAEVRELKREQYNVWEFRRRDTPTASASWKGYCDAYRLQ